MGICSIIWLLAIQMPCKMVIWYSDHHLVNRLVFGAPFEYHVLLRYLVPCNISDHIYLTGGAKDLRQINLMSLKWSKDVEQMLNMIKMSQWCLIKCALIGTFYQLNVLSIQQCGIIFAIHMFAIQIPTVLQKLLTVVLLWALRIYPLILFPNGINTHS